VSAKDGYETVSASSFEFQQPVMAEQTLKDMTKISLW
jgi:hypothetical protein